MTDKETMAEFIRRKVTDKKGDRSLPISDCQTTEVSASQATLNNSSQIFTGAVVRLVANPLLPVCIGLSIVIVILMVLLVLRSGH
jgi:hypothetical protein